VTTEREDRVTLAKHLETVIADYKVCMEQRFACLAEATDVARREMNRRLDGMNELREQLNRQEATYLTKTDYSARHEGLVAKIDEVRSRMDKLEARSTGLNAGWAYLIGIAGLMSAVISALYLVFRRT
jgi:hypothetical protein